MELIIGGAYQGKLEYVLKNYSLDQSDVFTCESADAIDTSKRVIYHFEKYLEARLCEEINNINSAENRNGEDFAKGNTDAQFLDSSDGPVRADISSINFRDDTIIIVDDIFSGVVPMENRARLFREYCGRTVTSLSEKCEHVIRIFCGLPVKLK